MESPVDAGVVGLGWTERAYAVVPLSPAGVGAALAGVLVSAFVVSELALGRHHLLRELDDPIAALSGARIAVVHCLFAAYLPTAYIYLLRGYRGALGELRGCLDCSDAELSALRGRVGRYPPLTLGLACVGGIALLQWITQATMPAGLGAWDWGSLSHEVRWHRAFSPWLGWWAGLYLLAAGVESRRLARLAARVATVDLLDLRPLRPFTRLALLNAFLGAGAFGIGLLILADTGFWDVVVWVWIAAVTVVGTGLFAALLPVHRVIRDAKRSELDWCRDALIRERAKLREGGAERTHVAELVAYQTVVDGVSAWPIDSSTFARFSLYLLIPLGSWAGGAIVERFVDSLLG